MLTLVSYVLGQDLSAQGVVDTLGERFSLAPQGRTHEILTYLDSFDWRLFRKGLLLTSRARRRQAALSLSGAASGPLAVLAPRIPSWPEEIPESPLRDALTAVMGPRCLLPQVRVRAATWRWSVLNEDQKTVVRVTLREGRAFPGGALTPPGSGPEAAGKEGASLPPLLHLQPLKGYEGELGAVVRFLARTLALRAAERGELALALEAVGRSPGDYSSSFSLALDPGMPADAGVRSILGELTRALRANEEGTLADVDPEFLHDFRVAIRRTRSALGQLRKALPREETAHFEEEFRWIGGRTGPTRDLDVYLLKIPEYRAALPDTESEALAPLVRFLEARKRREHRALVRTLGSRRWRRLGERWERFLEGEESEAAGSAAALPLRTFAARRIGKAFHRVLALGAAITDASPPEELHALRIECKKLRYLLTFFQSLYPPEALAPPAGELKSLQDNLGDYNDLQVQIRALRGFAEEMMDRKLAPPETFLAMGRLVGQLETRQLLERKAFHRRFRTFARRKSRRHFEGLLGSGGGDPQAPQGRAEAP